MDRCWAEIETEENNKRVNETTRISIRKYSIKKLNPKIRKGKPEKSFEFQTGWNIPDRTGINENTYLFFAETELDAATFFKEWHGDLKEAGIMTGFNQQK